MDGLKLRDNCLIFVGATIHDENHPIIGKCVFSFPSKTLSIFNFSNKPLFEEKLISVEYEHLNQYISILNFKFEKGSCAFHVGLFPQESFPIDNITDSLNETYLVTDPKAVTLYMEKNGPHSIIQAMAKQIQSCLMIK